MELSLLHFAQPLFLWIAIAIPLVGLAYWLFYKTHNPIHHIDKFIDRHLLPYLLVKSDKKKYSPWKMWLLWALAWTFLTVALAGPRWSFRELETFSKDQSLVILLDLSESMNATDVKPSRLILAKQKIEDLINNAKGIKMGLIAFAADPHVIAPLTEDTKTLRHILPSLDTELVHIQGSRLSPALERAYTLLQAEPGNNKAILVISDGGYEDTSAIKTAKSLADKGIIIHTLGVGTLEGAPIKDPKGNIIKKNSIPVISKLEKERFSEISRIGKGHFFEANHAGHEEDIILTDLNQRAEAQLAIGKKSRYWEEKFYIPLIMALPIVLWWFRKGNLFVCMLALFLTPMNLHAGMSDYFKNADQQAQEAMSKEDYETAIEKFQDPYRKGVACYKAGKFAEAEKLFQQSSRSTVACDAMYNRGNSLAQQLKLKEAIEAYEDVLKQWPEHTKAKENLELLKKMQEQNPTNDSSDNSDPSQDDNNDTQDKNSQRNQNSNPKDPSPPDQSKNKDNQNQEKDQSEDPSQAPQESQENDPINSDPQKQEAQPEQAQQQSPEDPSLKTPEDFDADALLNRIESDPKTFMKNKFYIESQKNGTKEGVDPW